MALQRDLISVRTAYQCERGCDLASLIGGFNMALDSYTAVGIAEGFIDAESEEQVLDAWQFLVDTGLAWKLQGFFGRTATALIEEGLINA